MLRRLLLVALVATFLLPVSPTPASAGEQPVGSWAGIAASPAGGYWLVGRDGAVAAVDGAPGLARIPATDAVAIAADPRGRGAWVATASGDVRALGAAPSYGSLAGQALHRPVVGIAATPDGGGYWLVASDGGVFAFGDAPFLGSLGNVALVEPIVGMAATPGHGYWLVASDGGVFTFGDAPFLGSTGGRVLNAPVVGMAATAAGDGYWLAAGDGGVFTFGTAPFTGPTVGGLPAVGIARVGGGYVLARSPAGPAVPAGSGAGRRIVYSNPLQRVWLVGADERVERTYLVSGRQGRPGPGTYHVFSKSTTTHALHGGITMRWMVRFAHGDRAAIGFHDIPLDGKGRPMQTDDDLGGYRSAGCVRQASADATFLWNWTPVGTTVVVVY